MVMFKSGETYRGAISCKQHGEIEMTVKCSKAFMVTVVGCPFTDHEPASQVTHLRFSGATGQIMEWDRATDDWVCKGFEPPGHLRDAPRRAGR